MIELKNLSKSYYTDVLETVALNDISLSIGAGEFVSIMGPSGCGKSTLLNMIGLLDSPTRGHVSINGVNLENRKENDLAKFRNENLGFIFQSFHLISDLSVIDNVELPLLYRGVGAKERKRLSEEALEKVGLLNRKNHYPNQLSGGQRQRVAIARAIVGKPALVMADEPTGNLDSVLGNEVMQLLLDLNEQEKVTVVMVTHDESMARKTHRVIRLYDGSLVN
ncbi:ABC transporter ATP-binding protein [Leadbetterella sp. DM7]|uniref:ABC transporter ATP-binding protein n=1 Tax=Leadbetterella sp. DM7 TaxID=3235085 RepID=UPI00349EABC4